MAKKAQLKTNQKQLILRQLVLWFDRLERADQSAVSGFLTVMQQMKARAVDGGGFRNPIERAYDDLFFNAYIVAISLKQISAHYGLLKNDWPTEYADDAREFRRLMRTSKVGFMRDLLEHSADYLAGRGKYQDRILDHDRGPKIELIESGRGIKTITTFGLLFNIGAVIAAAYQLGNAVRRKRVLRD